MLCRAYAGPGDEVLYTEHGFLMYSIAARTVGATPIKAPETRLTADVDATEITLEFQSRPNRKKTVRLRSIAGEFPVWIFNRELETILGVGQSSYEEVGSDPDFAISYALSSGWPFPGVKAALPIPHPDWEGAGGGRKTCNPARFASS